MPHLSGIQIMDERHLGFVRCLQLEGTAIDIACRLSSTQGRAISVATLETRVPRCELTYLTTWVVTLGDGQEGVLDEVKELLKEYKNLLPPKLPKELPPKRAIDDRIELVPGVSPTFQPLCRMPLSELVELRK